MTRWCKLVPAWVVFRDGRELQVRFQEEPNYKKILETEAIKRPMGSIMGTCTCGHQKKERRQETSHHLTNQQEPASKQAGIDGEK
ncbi:unnamed protein product [Linum tenue]|uniref:Uncharacterized protein n=1 Tax=Linum tenue TaxID=586396 RepID=A0AAV0P429_9ROSI|nr:unnamed protein product [Linum tenue]